MAELGPTRVGLDPIDGLTLYRISYRDCGRVRTIWHRISLVEMVMPYDDPTENPALAQLVRRGRGRFGRSTTSLRLGCHCLGEITYLDAVVADI